MPNKADIAITQNIRKALMRERALSTNAKNIKIITKNGVITLRGPVNSDNEREIILKIVDSTKGNARADSFLDVVTHP